MMRACPKCGPASAPHWWPAARTTRARNDGQHYWILHGCPHVAATGIISDAEKPALEAAWDAEAEKLFGEMTTGGAWSDELKALYVKEGHELPFAAAEGWTDPRRAAFRARIWPTPETRDLWQQAAKAMPMDTTTTKMKIGTHLPPAEKWMELAKNTLTDDEPHPFSLP